MSKQLLGRGRSIAVILALTSLALPGAAHAAFNDCPASFIADGTAKVHDGGGAPILTAANDCEYITPADSSNVASEANIQGFFGPGFWDVWDASVEQVDLGAGAASGTWAIPGVADFVTYDYMITFKDGGGTNLISFKLNELFASGGWNTPFTDPPFSLPGASTSHNVSHYTISRRQTDGTNVPEPGTLALLGLGILGLGFVTRRSPR